ncbi:MAG: FHA domain-containing protein [Stigonema ocellatum SAG 48.90 = DSM 106950]|nr:FHA domain-containing protein [Stigonema ocellatum SAG 48.90 = DSM 106950]
MLIITLIDGKQQKPLQQWHFHNESPIWVGRSPENHVVLDADLVSRLHHLELRQIQPDQWELTSHGSNGTFLNGNRVQQIALTDGMEVQLAKGGPVLKFQLQNPTVAPPVAQVVSSASVQQEQANIAPTELETILSGINAQFPPAYFAQRQQEIIARLGEIQRLQASLQGEITRLQTLQQQPQPESSLLLTLSSVKEDLESQRQSLEQFQQQMHKVREFLDQLEKHLQANETLSQQIHGGTRVDTLVSDIRKQLQDLDQELGRIHEQHLLDNAKKTFVF